jgi:hypothetical protein
MSSARTEFPNPLTPGDSVNRIAREKSHWFDHVNERLSDGCSPLLVKETRQALKSRQFLYTYFILLLAVAAWVIIGISWNKFWDIDAEIDGRSLLFGMFVLMSIPLGMVIPFSAYRSLAKEYEDGTIQLISITTMKPYQILVGKLGSAILQMLVYLSVMAPCILLGYMLRGVSLPNIFFCLGIAVWGSLCLTVMGLFLGGLIKGKGLNTAVSVGFILLLAWIGFGWFWSIEEILRMPIGSSDQDERLVFYMFFLHSAAIALLLLVAAATQISFRADNHATPLRIVMMIHQGLFLGNIVLIVLIAGIPKEGVGICAMFAAHYWLLMGCLMVGEVPQISRRIKRTLPTSLMGRTVQSLLMPGPGRGLLFALAMLWGCGLTFVLLAQFQDALHATFGSVFGSSSRFRQSGALNWSQTVENFWIVFVTCFYPTVILSVTYLIARRIHRKGHRATGAGPGIALISGVVITVFSLILATLIHSDFGTNVMQDDSSFASFCNWYWMFGENLRSGRSIDEAWIVMFVLPMSLIIGIAVFKASKELLLNPVAVPDRVLEDSKPVEPELPPGESIEEIFGELGNR